VIYDLRFAIYDLRRRKPGGQRLVFFRCNVLPALLPGDGILETKAFIVRRSFGSSIVNRQS
jgi:hypothetical protein